MLTDVSVDDSDALVCEEKQSATFEDLFRLVVSGTSEAGVLGVIVVVKSRALS